MTDPGQDTLPFAVPEPPAPPPAAEFRAPLPGPRRYTVLGSPLDELVLFSDGESLTGLHMDASDMIGPEDVHDPGALRTAVEELGAYFAGELTSFSVPVAPSGTDFQLRVWSELTRIRYGATASYGDIAKALGSPGASRAVGTANNRNPVSVVIPCHRVIGAGGALVGYGGGLPRKRILLALERGR